MLHELPHAALRGIEPPLEGLEAGLELLLGVVFALKPALQRLQEGSDLLLGIVGAFEHVVKGLEAFIALR